MGTEFPSTIVNTSLSSFNGRTSLLLMVFQLSR